MSDLLSQFVASAKSVALSETEKAHVRQTLATNMRCEGSVLRFARGTVLTSREKDGGRLVLQRFMQEHPVERSKQWSFLGVFRHLRHGEEPRTLTRMDSTGLTMTCKGARRLEPSQMAEFLGRFLSLRFASGVMAGLIVFFSVGGAAAYAAESALPGDPLYPLKIYITEPLREHLSVTPRARAAWRAERIVRRLREEEVLLASASDREMDVVSLEENVIYHMEKMEERLEELESEDDKEVLRVRLEGAIQRHEDVLSQWEDHELPTEKVPEFHKRMKQKKQFLRNVFREHVRKPVKDVFEVKGEVEVDEHGDETEESPASAKAEPVLSETEGASREEIEETEKDPSNDLPVDLLEEPMKEKHVPRVPMVLPRPLQKDHKAKDPIHRDADTEEEADQSVERQNKIEERKEEYPPSFFQDLQRKIFPSTLFKSFPREE